MDKASIIGVLLAIAGAGEAYCSWGDLIRSSLAA